jgi:hypothetical protein
MFVYRLEAENAEEKLQEIREVLEIEAADG